MAHHVNDAARRTRDSHHPTGRGLRTRRRDADSIVQLGALATSPTGITATLRALVRVTDEAMPSFGFAVIGAPYPPDSLDLWVTAANDPAGPRSWASVQQGGAGQNDGIWSARFELWFPIPLTTPVTDLALCLTWPERNIPQAALPLSARMLADAVRRSLRW